MTLPLDAVALVARTAKQQLWRAGLAGLAYLDTAGPTGGQRAWVAQWHTAPPGGWCAWKVARQRGKSYAALIGALQAMVANPGTVCVYLAQTGGNARAIVSQFFASVQADLPPELAPTLTQDAIILNNNSMLEYFGTDNDQYRRRRGRNAKLLILDEAAFYSDLAAVEQVYSPQLQTTGGVGLYLSSPPISPAHEFNFRCRALSAVGRYVHDTFYSNPRINHAEVIRAECERLGLTTEELLKSTAFRREYLAEDVTEESRAAMPAWTQARHATLVSAFDKPKYFDAYESVDLGFSPDPSAALFGYLEFETQTVCIFDELEIRGEGVRALSEGFKAKEASLWGASKWDGTLLALSDETDLPEYLQNRLHRLAPSQPFCRVGDNSLIVLSELASTHGVAISPARKDNKHLAVDFVNQLIIEGRLRIHSRCTRLIEQLYTTVWNNSRTAWERTAKDHGDLIDALVYLVRSIRWHKDPRPKSTALFESTGNGWGGVFTR